MSSPSMSSPPVTGLPAGVRTAPLGHRLVAQLVDLVPPALILLVTLPGETSLTGGVVATLLIVGWVAVVLLMFRNRAAGPGMRLLKLQLVRLRNGRPLDWRALVVRELVLGVLTVTLVGLVAMLVVLRGHPRRQGWHDLVADSVAIRERGLAPRQPKQQNSQATPAVTAEARPVPASPNAPAPAGSAPAGPATPSAAPAPASVALGSSKPTGQGSAGPPPATSHLDRGWCAVLDDDRRLEITGLVLLGRNPQARPGEDDAELVKVADETRTVSKTHLAMGVDANGLYVMDRGSTNGTTLTRSNGTSIPCPAGDLLSAADGSIVSFGDHWLRIEHRAQ